MSDPPFGIDQSAKDETDVEAAERTVDGLQQQIDALTATRSRAESEARRIAAKADEPALAELVRRYESQSAVLTSEISILRTSLRGAEARLQRLRGRD